MRKWIALILILSSIIFISCDKKTPPIIEEPPVIEETKHKIDSFYDNKIQDTIYILDNKTIQTPETPLKDGYVFSGWFVDYSCSELFDFTKPITTSLTIYGDFLKIYDVSFKNIELENIKVTENECLDTPITVFENL